MDASVDQVDELVERIADRPLGDLPIAAALRLVRRRQGLTQIAISQRAGARDHRTVSHWETVRTVPSLQPLANYLAALGLDFNDLQEALEQVRGGSKAAGLAARVAGLTARVAEIEGRVDEIEGAGSR